MTANRDMAETAISGRKSSGGERQSFGDLNRRYRQCASQHRRSRKARRLAWSRIGISDNRPVIFSVAAVLSRHLLCGYAP